jgi:hypothetical protein
MLHVARGQPTALVAGISHIEQQRVDPDLMLQGHGLPHGTAVGKSKRRVRGRDDADHRAVTSKHPRAIRLAVERKNDRKGLVGAERRLSVVERPDTDDGQGVADQPLLRLAPRAIVSLVLRLLGDGRTRPLLAPAANDEHRDDDAEGRMPHGLYDRSGRGNGRRHQLADIVQLIDLPAQLDHGLDLGRRQDEDCLIAELLFELLVRERTMDVAE